MVQTNIEIIDITSVWKVGITWQVRSWPNVRYSKHFFTCYFVLLGDLRGPVHMLGPGGHRQPGRYGQRPHCQGKYKSARIRTHDYTQSHVYCQLSQYRDEYSWMGNSAARGANQLSHHSYLSHHTYDWATTGTLTVPFFISRTDLSKIFPYIMN